MGTQDPFERHFQLMNVWHICKQEDQLGCIDVMLLLAEKLKAARQISKPHLKASAIHVTSQYYRELGNVELADLLLQESLSTITKEKDWFDRTEILFYIIESYIKLGETTLVESLLQGVLQEIRECRDLEKIRFGLYHVSQCYIKLKNYQLARSLLQETLNILNQKPVKGKKYWMERISKEWEELAMTHNLELKLQQLSL